MNLNRRTLLAISLGLMLPVPALAAAPAELETQLSKTSWVGDGEPSRRHVYVVFAPWCPVCKLLFQRTRSARQGIQLRWIASGSRDDHTLNQNLNVVGSRSLDVLTRVFQQSPMEDMSKDGAALIRLAMSEMTIKEVAKQINFTGYPTLIFTDRKGELRSVAGVPGDLDTLFAQVGAFERN